MTGCIRTFIWLISIYFIASCGFHPIYAKHGNNIVSLVKIDNIDHINGGEIKNQIEDLFYEDYAHSDPRYLLKLSVTQRNKQIAVNKFGADDRVTVFVTVNYQLIDISSGKIIDHGSVGSNSSAKTEKQQFARFTTDRKTIMLTMPDIALLLRSRILLALENLGK